MTALDRLVPGAHLLEIDGIDVAAPASRVWERLRHGEFAPPLATRALFALRALTSGPRASLGALSTVRVDDLASTRDRAGFQVLADEPPREIAMGAIGQVWRLDVPYAHVAAADDFAAFAQPGYVKVAWACRVVPRGEQASRLEVELRVAATDVRAWRRFRRYFRLIAPFSAFIRRACLRSFARALGEPAAGAPPPSAGRRAAPVRMADVLDGCAGAAMMALALVTPFLRRRRRRWGLDPAMATRVLPGDDLITDPRWSWTHGIEIEAPAEDVWPWVAQIGADKGGFYSYQWLENLAGCGIRNAETIHRQWEAGVGAGLELHPSVPPLQIVSVQPGRHLVAHAPTDRTARATGTPWVEASWLFLVEPIDATRCRFMSRYRVGCSNDVITRLSFGPTFVEAIGFAMDRRMLLGVKQRAEAAGPRALAA